MGFRFSAVFGFFETGDFNITIPIKGEINEVIVKTRMNETPIWNDQEGFISQMERYGIYVKLERNDVYSLSISYEDFDGGMNNADFTALPKMRMGALRHPGNSSLMPMWRKCI